MGHGRTASRWALIASRFLVPASFLSAVLAGILLPFCLAPVHALAAEPLPAGVIVGTWLIGTRFAPRFAAPAALAALVGVVLARGGTGPGSLMVSPQLTAPSFTWHGVLSVAVPLYLVTMAGQNLVGATVLAAHGHAPPLGRLLLWTCAASEAAAPFGSPPINLAALTAALTAGPAAHPDATRRWQATVASGATFLGLAGLAPLSAGLIVSADTSLVAAAVGLALLGAFAGAAADCFADDTWRLPATVTFLVTASGVSVGGLGSAPLGLAAGVLLWRTARRTAPATDRPGGEEAFAAAFGGNGVPDGPA